MKQEVKQLHLLFLMDIYHEAEAEGSAQCFLFFFIETWFGNRVRKMFILILNQTFRVIFLSVPHTLACSLLVLHNKLHTSYLKISSDVWDKSASRAKALFTDPPKLYWQVYHFCLNLLKYSLRGLRRFRLYFTVYPNSSHSTDIINFLI